MSKVHNRNVEFTPATECEGAHEAYFYCTEAEVSELRELLMARKVKILGDFQAATVGTTAKTEFYKVDVEGIGKETGDALADEFNQRKNSD